LYTISLTDFVGMEMPGFAVSVLPGPPAGVVEVEVGTSPLVWEDFDESLSFPDPGDDDDDDDDDDDEDEYRSNFNTQQRDWKSDCEIGRKFVAHRWNRRQQMLAGTDIHTNQHFNLLIQLPILSFRQYLW